ADVGDDDASADFLEAGLRKSQGDGGDGLHSWRVGDASLGVETRGNVDRDHALAGAVDGIDPLRKLSLGRPREAGAEDGVDDHVRILDVQLVPDLDADPAQGLEL